MAIRLAMANTKGGIGKSTSAMMIAEGLAVFHGCRVLVIDLDQQASVTAMLLSSEGALDAAARHRTMADLLQDLTAGRAISLGRYVSPKASDIIELRDAQDHRRVDLIASNRELLRTYQSLERIIQEANPEVRIDAVLADILDTELNRLDRSYDVVIFDCPAGAHPLGAAALRLSQHVIAPTSLDDISLRVLSDFVSIVLRDDLDVLNNLRGFKVLCTMIVGTNPAQRARLEHIRSGAYQLDALPKTLSHSVHIQRATTRLRPNSFRSVRDKYEGALDDLRELSNAVANLIRT